MASLTLLLVMIIAPPKAEVPAVNDEHQRNAGIVSTVNAELAIRSTKEMALTGELAAARQTLAGLVSQLAQVRAPFESVTRSSDVELFLCIDSPSFLPKFKQRPAALLHKTLEEVRQHKRETHQRKHVHTEGMPKRVPHQKCHEVLKEHDGTHRRVDTRLGNARSGEAKLRAAVRPPLVPFALHAVAAAEC